ncbi:MAG: pantoate--beta-alanine ligase [Flaviaesturariibacter sp.]|nr:pantoate--beta-alanine ligase [Flaviaesturariibacter sp.]
MVIFKTARPLTAFLADARAASGPIGFVPTMGALHEGHLSLIRQSKAATGLTVCSIFVNPTQFNNADDLKHYPVTIESDIEMLIGAGCDVLFLPPVAEVYPAGHEKLRYDLGALEAVLEGAYRPGHFQGVCEVVDRLLEIVEPDHLFMGQKDFQQCLVIGRLLDLTNRAGRTALHVEPTLREKDGLAMSSRNRRLTPADRAKAIRMSQVLVGIRDRFASTPPRTLEQTAITELTEAGFKVDYVSISNRHTLLPLEPGDPAAVALVAASLGPVRLIDNLVLDSSAPTAG